MSATPEQVVAEARSWIGTPYHHQARTKGVGCDCGGLIGGVAVALGLVQADWWESVFDPAFGGYDRYPSPGSLLAACNMAMEPVETEPEPGLVVAIQYVQGLPQHLAFVAPYVHGGLSLVHALNVVGKVREHRLPPEWRERIVAVYRLPGVVA